MIFPNNELASYVEHMRKRFLQDLLAEATSAYWLRRSRAFDGVGTPECDEIAEACRNRAAVAIITNESDSADLATMVMAEVS